MGFAGPAAQSAKLRKGTARQVRAMPLGLVCQSPAATGTRCFRGRCKFLLLVNYGIISLQEAFCQHTEAQWPVYVQGTNLQVLHNIHPA